MDQHINDCLHLFTDMLSLTNGLIMFLKKDILSAFITTTAFCVQYFMSNKASKFLKVRPT